MKPQAPAAWSAYRLHNVSLRLWGSNFVESEATQLQRCRQVLQSDCSARCMLCRAAACLRYYDSVKSSVSRSVRICGECVSFAACGDGAISFVCMRGCNEQGTTIGLACRARSAYTAQLRLLKQTSVPVSLLLSVRSVNSPKVPPQQQRCEQHHAHASRIHTRTVDRAATT